MLQTPTSDYVWLYGCRAHELSRTIPLETSPTPVYDDVVFCITTVLPSSFRLTQAHYIPKPHNSTSIYKFNSKILTAPSKPKQALDFDGALFQELQGDVSDSHHSLQRLSSTTPAAVPAQ